VVKYSSGENAGRAVSLTRDLLSARNRANAPILSCTSTATGATVEVVMMPTRNSRSERFLAGGSTRR
jgi:hypothetical protein